MKKIVTIVLLSTAPAVALADAPAPDPTLQSTLTTTQNQNLNDAYTAGTSYQNYEADTSAANTAQDIATQDLNSGGGFGSYTVMQQAAQEARSVATDYQNQASQQLAQQQPAVTDGNATADSAATLAPAVAQSGAANGQVYASSDFATQSSGTQASTGVSMGQLTPGTDVTYALAGAGEQAVMSGLATGGYQANDNAYQAAMNAAGCGINAGCYAFWIAMNEMYQGIADADYAANVAAAPVLAAIDDAAAVTHATSDAQNMFAQITSLTGVAQGQNAGAATTAQATQQTTAQTGVTQGQTADMTSTDTSYTNAADGDWSSMQAAEEQNNQATVNAAQAWQQNAAAQASEDAANQIAGYDEAQARSSFNSDYQAWMQAAGIAQNEAGQYQSQAAGQLAIQQQNITTGNTSYVSADALAPSVGAELDNAAAQAASTDAANVIQQINSAAGVAQ